MIPLLEQITQHTCATQHCQALLFRHFGLGLAHYTMADHHEATKHFMEYRSLALTLARPADISLAHVYLGDISTIKSNYSNAAYHYLEAIHNYGTNNPSTLFKLVMPSVSALYAKQGAALKQTSQMLQAVEAFRNAIHHAPDIKSRLPVHSSLGNLLQSMGDYTGALQEPSAEPTNNLGTAYESMEDFKGAEENFNLALDQAIYGNDVAGQARARGTMVPSPGFTPTGLYRLGASDLTQAIELCNEVLQSTKGSMQGLSLSVSLIESSSRTFHKLQDCLIGLQQMDEALVIAEQCRARTLRERLLEKMGGGVNHLTPPLSLEQMRYIVKSQEHPVVYLSYTGVKLIVWLIISIYGHVQIDCRVVEVEKLEKEKFGGKTFDQYVRQSVQEAVPTPPGAVMYNSRTACVVGNPHIPIFEHNNEEWSLGRLPHATDEAKWISQLLKVQPLLHEQATKVAVVKKLSPAQVIHLATHGSAEILDTLAFAGPDSSNGKPSPSEDILLQPNESAGMFMQFFYQYLVDGLGTVHAFQKGHSECVVLSKQILLGYEGPELTDPVKTFIHSYYDYSEVIDEIELKTHNIAALVVLESIGPDTLTSFSSLREMAKFHKLLCHICTHIIATLHAGNNTDLSSIVGQIDTLLIRGSNIIEVEPFSLIHTTQRIVYGHLQKTKCPSPSDEDRAALEILVDITKGSTPVIDIMTSKGMCSKYPESLDAFTCRLVFTADDESELFSNVVDKQPIKARNCVSFDLWDAINTLADLCELTSYEELFSLSLHIS
eukprot:Em0423g3a